MKKYNFIYKTTNRINDKIYVGKHSTNILEDSYLGSGMLLKKSIRKQGKENFNREILEFCDTIEKLNEREVYWIENLNTITPNGYNICEGGSGGDTISNHPNKEEIKKKTREINKKIDRSEQNRLHSIRMRGEGNPKYNKQTSEETRIKISKANKGKKSPEHVIAINSKRWSGSNNPMYNSNRTGDKNPFYGKKHSKETIKILKEKAKNRKKVICIHCGLSTSITNNKRWHGNNCKKLK